MKKDKKETESSLVARQTQLKSEIESLWIKEVQINKQIDTLKSDIKTTKSQIIDKEEEIDSIDTKLKKLRNPEAFKKPDFE